MLFSDSCGRSRMGKKMRGGCTAHADDPRRFHSFRRSGRNVLFGDSCGRSMRGKKTQSGCTVRVEDPR